MLGDICNIFCVIWPFCFPNRISAFNTEICFFFFFFSFLLLSIFKLYLLSLQTNSEGLKVKDLYFIYLTILRKVANNVALLKSTAGTSKSQVMIG